MPSKSDAIPIRGTGALACEDPPSQPWPLIRQWLPPPKTIIEVSIPLPRSDD